MSLDDSQNWFDEIIEYDGDGGTDRDSGKENDPINIVIKQPKTSKVQFQTIEVFMKQHDEELIDKDTYNLLWGDLAARLNDIGPPDHTVAEWKRIWSVHKSNAKRKYINDMSDTAEPRKSVRSEKPSTSQSDSSGVPNDLGLSEISGQLSIIIENQSKMIVNETLIIQEMKNSNKLLQELVKKS